MPFVSAYNKRYRLIPICLFGKCDSSFSERQIIVSGRGFYIVNLGGLHVQDMRFRYRFSRQLNKL